MKRAKEIVWKADNGRDLIRWLPGEEEQDSPFRVIPAICSAIELIELRQAIEAALEEYDMEEGDVPSPATPGTTN